jgi:ankyrin repeat protein
MYAALNGHNDIVVALLDKGAEVNTRNKRGITSLMYAAYGGRIQVAQTLLAKGAEVDVKDNEGLTMQKQPIMTKLAESSRRREQSNSRTHCQRSRVRDGPVFLCKEAVQIDGSMVGPY